MTGQCCGNCNLSGFVAFHMTPTGRFKKYATASCNYEIPKPTLPDSVRGGNRENAYPKGFVSPTDGTTCPVWGPKGAK